LPFRADKKEEGTKRFFFSNRKEKKAFGIAGIEPSPLKQKNLKPITRKSTRTFRTARTERRLKQKIFSSKTIIFLQLIGIEPSSLQPALNPAHQSGHSNLAPRDPTGLKVSHGQRGAKSGEKRFFFHQSQFVNHKNWY